MVPEIKYYNFRPQTELALEFERRITEFSEYCAEDSYIVAKVVFDEGVYNADVSVRYHGGQIAVRCSSVDFSELTNDLLDKLYVQLRLWRERRFVEPFHIENDKEADGLSAVNSEPDSGKQSHTQSRALIVDDDPGSITVLQAILKKAGFATKAISDSFRAVKEMATMDYDLVILDWCMPYMDGGEIISHVESAVSKISEEERRPIPVITCSGLDKTKLRLPKSNFVHFIDHWDKALPFSSILTHAQHLLPTIKTMRAS